MSTNEASCAAMLERIFANVESRSAFRALRRLAHINEELFPPMVVLRECGMHVAIMR